MRQPPEYMESIRNSASMQSVQRYGRDTILQLLSHIDTIETELRIAIEDEDRVVAQFKEETNKVDRLIKNVVELQRELVEAREGKKVVLTREEADALEQFKKERMNQADYLAWLIPQNNSIRSEAHRTLWDSANSRRFLVLVNALQYSYTVEEPIDHEQRLRIELEKLITTWDGRSRYTLNKDIGELLTDHFQEIAK